MLPWIFLSLAVLTEIGWAVSLKLSEGYTRLWPTVISFVFLVATLTFLSLAMKKLSLTLAYGIWTGLGIAGTSLVAMAWLGEPVKVFKIISILLILIGAAGLKVSANS